MADHIEEFSVRLCVTDAGLAHDDYEDLLREQVEHALGDVRAQMLHWGDLLRWPEVPNGA